MFENILIHDLVDDFEMLKKQLEKNNQVKVTIVNKPYLDTLYSSIDPVKPVLLITSRSISEQVRNIRNLRAKYPFVQFLYLSDDETNETLYEIISSGFSGIISKNSAYCVIIDSITQLFQGGMPIPAKLSNHILNQFIKPRIPKPTYFKNISQREEQILMLLSKGFLYTEIAERLNISLLTVKNHLKNIYKKLNVKNRHQATITFNQFADL